MFSNAMLNAVTMLLFAGGPVQPPGGGADVGGFEIDASALENRPADTLPQQLLPASAFAVEAIWGGIVQSTELPGLVDAIGNREYFESPTWYLERNAVTGAILILRKPVPVDPQPQDENALRLDSLQRLSAWGLPATEVQRVLQRRVLVQHESDYLQQPTPPIIHRYKTFVFRGINGVPIEGSRAVLTHHRDGSFNRALINWPPLAPTGHKLRSDLTVTEITARAIAALRRAGEREGEATLTWCYRPTELDDGSIALELVVNARMPATHYEDGTSEEPRVITVKIDAY